MKHKLIPILVFLSIFASTNFAYATNVSWDQEAGYLQPLQTAWTYQVKVPYITATSTIATSTLLNTNLSGPTVEILGQYITNLVTYIRSQFTQGTGISISGGTITNSGVTSIVAGTNVSISGATGAVTINSSATGGSGNVATSSAETAGQLAVFGSTNGTPAKIYSQATTSLGVSTPITFSGTPGAQVGGSAGTFGFDFTHANTWTGLQNFGNATTSQLTSTGPFYLTGITGSRVLATDANGMVTATTSIGANNITGVLPIANGGTGASALSINGIPYVSGGKLTTANVSLFFDGTSLNAVAPIFTGTVNSASETLSGTLGVTGKATFGNASTTILSGTTICFTGDTCRTTWPSGSASTTLLSDSNTFSGHNIFTASTTIQAQLNLQNASSSVLSATTFCLTGDTCRTTWPTGGTGITWPWTQLSNFGTTTNATTTAYTAPAYFASSSLASVFPYASSTALTVQNNIYTHVISSGVELQLRSTGSSVQLYDNSNNEAVWGLGSFFPAASTGILGLISNPWADIYVANASTTGQTISGTTWLTGLATTGSALLTVDSSGKVGTTSLSASGITALGNYATTTGTAISFSTSTAAVNGLTYGMTIAASANGILFTPTVTGTLANAGLAHSTIVLNGTTLTLGDSADTITAASSSALIDSNTFSGVDKFTNASSDFSGTWQTFSPSHFQTALGFTAVPNTRNVNTTFPLQGGGALSADLTLTSAFGTTTNSGLTANQFVITNSSGVLVTSASSTLNLPNTALQNSTISGIALGSALNAHTHDSTLTGTSYNGSAAVSNWGLDLTHANSWTGLQSFTNATTTQLTATGAVYLTGITAGSLLSTNASQQLAATSSIGLNLISTSGATAGQVIGDVGGIATWISTSTSAGGTNYFTNAAATTTLNTGSMLVAGAFTATTTNGTATSTFPRLYVGNNANSNTNVIAAFIGQRVQMGPVLYPDNYVPACATCFYLSLDKAATADDTSVVFRDQGNARAEIGLVGDNSLHFKTITGSYPTESFTDVMTLTPAKNVGIGTTTPTTLLSVGTNSNFTVDYSGNASTTGSVTIDGSYQGIGDSGLGNGVLSIVGHEASGQGAYERVRDDTLGTIGYFGQNSVINGGTAYAQFDVQNPQSTGALCFSAGGRSSATAGASCDIFDSASGLITFLNASSTNLSVASSFGLPVASDPLPTSAGYLAFSSNSPFQLHLGNGTGTTVFDPTVCFTFGSPATTTAWTGSTTATVISIPKNITWTSEQTTVQPAGATLNVQYQYANPSVYTTVFAPMWSASSTPGTVVYSSNNTPNSAATSTITYGTPSGSPVTAATVLCGTVNAI